MNRWIPIVNHKPWKSWSSFCTQPTYHYRNYFFIKKYYLKKLFLQKIATRKMMIFDRKKRKKLILAVFDKLRISTRGSWEVPESSWEPKMVCPREGTFSKKNMKKTFIDQLYWVQISGTFHFEAIFIYLFHFLKTSISGPPKIFASGKIILEKAWISKNVFVYDLDGFKSWLLIILAQEPLRLIPRTLKNFGSEKVCF